MLVKSTISPSLKIGLRLLGVWPGVHSAVYWLIYISSVLIIQCFQYFYVFAHFKLNELSNLVDSISLTLEYSLTVLKLISLRMHCRVIQEILIAIDDDWRESINITEHLCTMTIKANISHYCSNAMLSINTFAAIFYLLSDYAVHAAHLIGDYNDTLRQLPIKVQLPFETTQTPIFELLAVTLFLHVMMNSLTVAALNGLIFSLVLHVSGQIDIICQEFKNICKKTQLYESSASMLRMLIEKHNKVISLSDNIKKLLSIFSLMQIILNTLLICCIGFIIVISLSNEAGIFVLVKVVVGYFAILTETFILCFAGEYLSHKSISISDAAYDSLWYDLPSYQSKIITFIIMRSQTRLTISAGKFTNLSLEAFATVSLSDLGKVTTFLINNCEIKIVKASASYISVFYAIY